MVGVRGRGSAVITVNKITGEDIPGLRIQQLILAIQIPARQPFLMSDKMCP